MKQSIILPAIFLTVSCMAQNVPDAVKSAFTKSFPGTTVKKWDKEDGNYEANFTKDGKTMSAVFDATGKWMETETDIDVKNLPTSITAYIKQHYSGMTIKEAATLKTPEGDRYEAEVKGKDLLFDANGKFIKEEED